MRVTDPTWGQSLTLAIAETRGMNPVVDSINSIMGEVASRNTFAKLCQMERVEDMSAKDLYRAWLLLLAIGEDPKEWDIPEPDMPPILVRTMRDELSPLSDSNRRPPLYKSGALAN
jgi:hypothetical protein